jgi:hypothetical protein
MLMTRWNGLTLVTKEDWAHAMESLRFVNEALRFKALARDAFAIPEWDKALGFLLGDVHPVHRDRVAALLGVSYPFKGVSSSELLMHGMRIGMAERVGKLEEIPAWMQVVMEIPRGDWSPYFLERPTE